MSTPARRRRSSGIFVIPDRRMSCSVMIDVEFGALSGLWAALDAVTTVSSKTPLGLELAHRRRRRCMCRDRGRIGNGFCHRNRCRRGLGRGSRRNPHRLLRLEKLRLLPAHARLQVRNDLRDVVGVFRVALEVFSVIRRRVLEVAHVETRAGDVVEEVRVRQDVVRPLQLLDARVVRTLRDRCHALFEVCTCFGGALVGTRRYQSTGRGRRAHSQSRFL